MWTLGLVAVIAVAVGVFVRLDRTGLHARRAGHGTGHRERRRSSSDGFVDGSGSWGGDGGGCDSGGGDGGGGGGGCD